MPGPSEEGDAVEEVARPPVVADEAKANDEDDDDIVMTSTTMGVLPPARPGHSSRILQPEQGTSIASTALSFS